MAHCQMHMLDVFRSRVFRVSACVRGSSGFSGLSEERICIMCDVVKVLPFEFVS